VAPKIPILEAMRGIPLTDLQISYRHRELRVRLANEVDDMKFELSRLRIKIWWQAGVAQWRRDAP
jgi:hypothetical protein